MPDLAQLLPMLLLLLAIGAFAGVISGLLGVGGGIILVPAFFYTFTGLGFGGAGVMRVAIATSLATIIVTSVRSVLAHNRRGAVDWAILRGWAPGIAIGAVVGGWVVMRLNTVALQMIFGCLTLSVALYLGLGRSDWRLGAAIPKGAARAAVSPLVGFLSVLMGIGGGSFGVPLMSLFGTPIHRAVATAAGFGVIIAVPSVAVLLATPVAGAPPLTLGAVNLPAFAVIIAMTLITAPLGVRLAHSLDPAPLKRIFAGFLAILALNMLRKAFGW
ncbi:MAG: sulfite exporter TauE/SafE family protein [Albidovulum sp.]